MKKKMRILTLTTYPFENPSHGGQHRIANIVRELASDGHEIDSIGVLGSDHYSPTQGFEAYPGMSPMTDYIRNPFLMDDWGIGRLFADNGQYFSALAAHAKGRYDVIFSEQPWLFRFAVRLSERQSGKKPILVYGSQNIEHRLKKSILSTYLDARSAEAGAKLVEATEREAIKLADAVVCVSESDRAWVKAQTTKEVILACNGVENRSVDDDAIAEANKFSGGRKFALYCASAHPPNMTGFFRYFGQGLGAISPAERLLIAGSAGPAIINDPRFHKAGNLDASCVSAGLVTESCLAGLLYNAHCIILPLSEGGGTNLKTAEALWSGRRIVGTTVAFRGFEEFISSPGVRIADEPPEFLAALRKTMSEEPLFLEKPEIERRKSVLWNRTLEPLVSYFRSL